MFCSQSWNPGHSTVTKSLLPSQWLISQQCAFTLFNGLYSTSMFIYSAVQIVPELALPNPFELAVVC